MPLKESTLVKVIIYFIVGIITYPSINIFNKLHISGTEHLKNLPKKNVLFVSNHQTYFADVIAFIHIFCSLDLFCISSFVHFIVGIFFSQKFIKAKKKFFFIYFFVYRKNKNILQLNSSHS